MEEQSLYQSHVTSRVLFPPSLSNGPIVERLALQLSALQALKLVSLVLLTVFVVLVVTAVVVAFIIDDYILLLPFASSPSSSSSSFSSFLFFLIIFFFFLSLLHHCHHHLPPCNSSSSSSSSSSFNCISFHKFSRQLSVFLFCSCGLSSALLVLSTIYLFLLKSLSALI